MKQVEAIVLTTLREIAGTEDPWNGAVPPPEDDPLTKSPVDVSPKLPVEEKDVADMVDSPTSTTRPSSPHTPPPQKDGVDDSEPPPVNPLEGKPAELLAEPEEEDHPPAELLESSSPAPAEEAPLVKEAATEETVKVDPTSKEHPGDVVLATGAAEDTVPDDVSIDSLSVSGASGVLAASRSTEVLGPGTIKVCNVEWTSFEIRWCAPVKDHGHDSYRLVLFDAERHTLYTVITKETSWTFIGLDPARTYGVTVTSRAVVLTYAGQPSERMCEFFIPDTTLMASVTTKRQDAELCYWFDGQINSYFTSRPFKLYLGTVQESDGSYLQETKFSALEAAVRFGIVGSSEAPGLAHVGISSLEVFSPYSLGAGAYVDFDVQEGHKAVYEIELAVMTVPPVPDDYATAPDHVMNIAKKAREARRRLQIEGPDNEAPGASLAMTPYDEEMLGGGVFLHARNRKKGAWGSEWASSESAKLMGAWEILKVRTQFSTPELRLYVQVPAKSFGSVLIDSLRVRYVGPSELELLVRQCSREVSAIDRDSAPALTLQLFCAEDLLNVVGGLYRSPVLAKLWWRGDFLAQTDVVLNGGDDPWFGFGVRLPVDLETIYLPDENLSDGLVVQIVDSMSLGLVGELRLRARDVLQHSSGPRVHPITRKGGPKKKRQGCCCGVCCCSSDQNKKNKRSHINRNATVAPSSPASGMDRGEGVAMDAMDEDALSSLEEGGPQKSDERAEQQEPPTPRGRVVLSLCRHDDQVPDKVPTEDDLKLLDLRDALHRRDRKAGRQLARICKSVRTDREDLVFKVRLVKLGVVEACISLLGDETMAPDCSECIAEFISFSEECLATAGGRELLKALKHFVHRQGAARAIFSLARARVRKALYRPDKVKVLLPLELLRLLVDLYVPNRSLLHECICEDPTFLEMIVRCLANEEDDPYGFLGFGGKHGAHLAEKLLEEVGLGKTMPKAVLDEYFRLRRIIPLDDRFWKCEALRSLPHTLPPRIEYLFDPDRVACLPPEQPDTTPGERCVYRFKKSVAALFNLTALAAAVMSLLSLMRNGTDCALTLAVLFASSITLVTVCFLRILAAMAKIGVGSQMAVICCPLVCCNVSGLVGSLVWTALLLFLEKGGTESCSGSFLQVTQAFVGFIGLGFASILIQTLRLYATKFCSLVSRRCCCCFRGLCKKRPRASEEGSSTTSGIPAARTLEGAGTGGADGDNGERSDEAEKQTGPAL